MAFPLKSLVTPNVPLIYGKTGGYAYSISRVRILLPLSPWRYQL